MCIRDRFIAALLVAICVIILRVQEMPMFIGVQDLLARGYFIPGDTSQRGAGWSGTSVPCRTLSDLDTGQAQNWPKIY